MNNNRLFLFLFLFSAFLFAGCASQRPVLYPNHQLKKVGQALAKQDIDECMRLASQAGVGTRPGKKLADQTVIGAASGAAAGAAVGAIRGNAGGSAAVGVAGAGSGAFMWGLFRANEIDPIQKRYVEECLRRKGYQTIGWK